MRTRFIYFSVTACLAALSVCGCKGDAEPALMRIKPSQIDDFPMYEYVLRNPGEADPVLFTVTWSETLFYMDDNSGKATPVAPVEYTLQVDKAGNGFDSAKTLAKTSSLASGIHTKEFNLLLLDSLGAKAGEIFDVELRLYIEYGQGLTRKLVSKNEVTLAITPFQDRDPLQPLYITGDMNAWEVANTQKMLPMFKDNSATTNQTYTFTGWFPANCNFKLVPKESLGTTKAYYDAGGNALEYEETGTPLVNTSAGYKTVTVNLRSMAWSIADYDDSSANNWSIMGFIGNFCNWENEPLMTQFSSENTHIWRLSYSLPSLAGNEVYQVKFRSARSWGSRWAALDPYDVPYGKTIYLTGDEADPNVVIDEGGSYEIVFNDLTGHYIILGK